MLRSIAAVAAAMALTFAGAAQASLFEPTGSATPPSLAQKLHQPVPASMLATLARATHAGLAITTQPNLNTLTPITGPHLDTGKKVGLLYVGADFCPYCAGQRWGLVLTLLRFGKFHGLRYMLSSATDVYANTPTVTFQHATYTSAYVDFQAVELSDRQQHPLMPLKGTAKAIFTTFDARPYVRFPGSIPFVYLGGQYLLKQLLVDPPELTGKNWRQIADTLADASSPLAQAVMPRVNLLTAAICQRDGNKPTAVCQAPGVQAALSALPSPDPLLQR